MLVRSFIDHKTATWREIIGIAIAVTLVVSFGFGLFLSDSPGHTVVPDWMEGTQRVEFGFLAVHHEPYAHLHRPLTLTSQYPTLSPELLDHWRLPDSSLLFESAPAISDIPHLKVCRIPHCLKHAAVRFPSPQS